MNEPTQVTTPPQWRPVASQADNPWLHVPLGVGVVAGVVGIVLWTSGVAAYDVLADTTGQIVLGIALVVFGVLLLIAWLVVCAIDWRLKHTTRGGFYDGA